MAGNARRIVIEFLGKDTSLGREAADTEQKVSKLGSRLKSVGKLAAVGLAAGVAVAGKAMFDATRAAMEDEASQAKLATQLRNSAKASDAQIASTERWISAQGTALGVTDDELRPALARLVTATGDVGKAQKLASLAMDASAGTGKSLKTVSEALAKAQNGNVSALSRLGVKTKDAAGETLSFEQVTRQMADTFKGQAEAKAGSLEGKMARLSLIFDETKEAIGSRLIPVVTKMADWFLNKGLPAIQAFGGWLQERIPPIFERVRAVVQSVMGGMSGDVGGNLGRVREIVANVVDTVRALWDRFGSQIIAITKTVFGLVRTLVRGGLQVVSGIFKIFSGILRGDWSRVWEGVKDVLRGAWTIIKGIVRAGLSIVKTLFSAGWQVVKDITRAAFSGLVGLARAGLDRVVDFIRSVPGRIRNLGGAFLDAGRSIIGKLVDGLKNASGIVSGIAGNVWSAVKGMLNSAIGQINAALEFTINPPGPGSVVVNPPDIPRLARGGIVRARRGGTLALLGEAGADEAVIPLTGRYAPRAASLGGQQLHFHFYGPIYGNERLAAKEVVRLLRSEVRLSGQGLGLG